jgi:hypothetical protein
MTSEAVCVPTVGVLRPAVILPFAAVIGLLWLVKPDIAFLLFAGAALGWLLPGAWRATGLERGPDYPDHNPQTTNVDVDRMRDDGGFGEMRRNGGVGYRRRSQ